MHVEQRPWSVHDDHWPEWVPAISVLVVGVTLALAMWARVTEGLPLRLATIGAALALFPFLFDLIEYRVARKNVYQLWLFPIPVLIGIWLMLYHPTNTDLAPFVLVFMCAEVVTRAERQMPIAIATGFAAAGVMCSLALLGRFDQGSMIWVVGIGFGWFGGFMVRKLDERTHELEEAQGALAEKAAADERSRIAREVHDVIAHSLSVTMLHVTAARMALEKGDEGHGALDALREAEQQGRRSLNEIRRTVGLLGAEDGSTAPPQPGASDIDALVREFRAAGVDITLNVEGDVSQLAPAAGLNLYRIVQESLTNAAKHAPGCRANVDLRVSRDDIHLTVRNSLTQSTPRQGNGLGLRGMAERAALLGGTLHTDNGDGWTVSVVAPRQAT